MKIKFPKDLKVQESVRKSLEFSALAFERKAKILTTEERHVVTGRYRSSINLNSRDGLNRDTVPETKVGDGIHEFVEDLTLRVGSNVEYAANVESKFGIMARALDGSSKEMKDLFLSSLKKNLEWLQ